MFQENGYPKSYFDKILKRFLTEQDAKEKTIPETSEKENSLLQYHIWKVNFDVS